MGRGYGQQRPVDEAAEVVAQPRVGGEGAGALTPDEIPLEWKTDQECVAQSPGEIAPVVGHAVMVLARSQGRVRLVRPPGIDDTSFVLEQ